MQTIESDEVSIHLPPKTEITKKGGRVRSNSKREYFGSDREESKVSLELPDPKIKRKSKRS